MADMHTSDRGFESSDNKPLDEANGSGKLGGASEEAIANSEKKRDGDDEDKPYPTGLRLVLIFVALCVTTFLVALDGTIIATAIPTITSDFDSLGDVAWYNASFFLTTAAAQIPFGRAYTLLSTKWVFLSSILIFEIGSVVCGAAPTSVALIIGRAIAGIGGAGIFAGCFITIATTTPLRKRSLFTGVIGATFAIASSTGPLIGGAFTTRVTWRWCFYINLPIGAIALLVVAFTLQRSVETRPESFEGKSWWQIISRFDPFGTLLFFVSIICLQLALQWGGTQYKWSSPRVLATLLVFGVLFIVWVLVQWLEGDNATVPLRLFTQRSVSGATVYSLFTSASFTAVVYYLPIWFQAIKQDNAEESGIHNLPLVLGLITFALSAGGAVFIVGYYTPFIILGTILASVGAGLLMSLKPDSGIGQWIGYQILFGAGIGVSLEQCNIAIQTVLPNDKIPAGTSLVLFTRSLGGSLAVAVAQNVFEKRLRQNLASVLPGLDIAVVGGSGATNLIAKVQEATGGNQRTLDTVLRLYNDALSQIFLVSLILAAISLLPALTIEWKSVKKERAEQERKREGKAGDGNEVVV